MADAGGFEPPTARFVAEYSIQLSYASGMKQILAHYLLSTVSVLPISDGGRRRIRTSDRSVRSRVLYPAELCVHLKNGGERGIRTLDRVSPIHP